MSGGTMDHLYWKVNDARFKQHTAVRKAFKKHLTLVAQALHDIEWVDSDDYGPGRENEAIMKCINDASVLEVLLEDAKLVHKDLGDFLKLVEDKNG